MQHVIKQTNVIYCGGDIVDDLVETNILQYGDKITKFIKLDICNDPLPSADIIISGDCLCHLSYNDIMAFWIIFLHRIYCFCWLLVTQIKTIFLRIKISERMTFA